MIHSCQFAFDRAACRVTFLAYRSPPSRARCAGALATRKASVRPTQPTAPRDEVGARAHRMIRASSVAPPQSAPGAPCPPRSCTAVNQRGASQHAVFYRSDEHSRQQPHFKCCRRPATLRTLTMPSSYRSRRDISECHVSKRHQTLIEIAAILCPSVRTTALTLARNTLLRSGFFMGLRTTRRKLNCANRPARSRPIASTLLGDWRTSHSVRGVRPGRGTRTTRIASRQKSSRTLPKPTSAPSWKPY